jgi:hypothetical protein
LPEWQIALLRADLREAIASKRTADYHVCSVIPSTKGKGMMMSESGNDRLLLLPVHADDDVLGGHGFAAVPFTADTLRFLLGRCAMFRRAKSAYPDLYATMEFDYSCEWHDTGDPATYEDESGAHERIEALADDRDFLAAIDSSEETDDLQIIDAGRVPESGIRTECDCLNISGWPDDSRPLNVWWTADLKNTNFELRTGEIRSDQLERWLAEIETSE